MMILEKYNRRVEAVGSLLCVGLDPELERIPEPLRSAEFPLFEFNRWVIEKTYAYTAAYKPNAAFYEAHGVAGAVQLKMTMDYLRENHAEIVTICDAKRGDNANTNLGYVRGIFDVLGADAVTLHSYMGEESLVPFLARADKACLILCRTSNVGAREFQDLLIDGKPQWQVVAETVSKKWNARGNCMLVVGATYPEEMRRIRTLAPELTLLVPGVGTQGGDVAAVIAAGLDANGRGLMMSASRAVMFADDPALAARTLRDEIRSGVEATLAAR